MHALRAKPGAGALDIGSATLLLATLLAALLVSLGVIILLALVATPVSNPA